MQTQDFLQDGPYNGVCVCVLIAGWYLRQKPVVSPPFLFPFPSLPLSIPPYVFRQTSGREGEGEVPRLPPYKYHPG